MTTFARLLCGMMINDNNTILFCLYTCEADEPSLHKLKETDWYKELSTKSNTKFIEIYADPDISSRYILCGNRLTVKTEESYDNLCIKTYKMIEACSREITFDYLVKLDCNIIENRHNKTSNLFSFEYFIEKFNDPGIIGEYNGLTPIKNNTVSTFRNWASMKKIFVMPEALISDIGEDKWPTEYWAGGCYCLGKKSVAKILKQKELFYKFKRLMGACEDMAIAAALR